MRRLVYLPPQSDNAVAEPAVALTLSALGNEDLESSGDIIDWVDGN